MTTINNPIITCVAATVRISKSVRALAPAKRFIRDITIFKRVVGTAEVIEILLGREDILLIEGSINFSSFRTDGIDIHTCYIPTSDDFAVCSAELVVPSGIGRRRLELIHTI